MIRNGSVGTRIGIIAFAVLSATAIPLFPAAYNKNVNNKRHEINRGFDRRISQK